MSLFFSLSTQVSSRSARKPPMLASPSFLALIVQPSESEKISRTISAMERPDCPGSRCRTNQAFSANRHASISRGIPWRRQSSCVSRTLESETGCPPPELFRKRQHDKRHAAPVLFEAPLQPRHVHVPLERMAIGRLLPLRNDEVQRDSSVDLDVGACRFEMSIVRNDVSRLQTVEKSRFSATLPWCVGMTWGRPK